jgi:sulfate/thiosulfate transport system permease protein
MSASVAPASRLQTRRPTRLALRVVALAYLALLLIVPVGMIFWHTLRQGLGPIWDALTNPEAVNALILTLKVAAIVVPLNTVFGIVFAIAMVRHRMPAKWFWNTVLDLPFAVSPVIAGLTLILVYGTQGWFGSWFVERGFPIIFSTPGIVLATLFVSLPFVAREVIPVLREVGEEQEEAAATLGATTLQRFFRITLPAIRWAVVYGVVLTTARSIGEFGAVAVVGGRVIGQTQTLTLRVESSYENFDKVSAYTAALELAFIALATLFLMNVLNPRRKEGSR